VTLPRGATPVDFAYYIHTEVGHKCIGSKINGRIVPLKHRLANGEIVEIITAEDAHPSREWLTFAKTSRARGAVRRWINLKQKEQAIEIGQKLLEKEARRFKISLKKYKTKFEEILHDLSMPKAEDLYAAIGYGKVAAKQVLAKLDPDKTNQEIKEAPESRLTSMVKRVFRRTESAIQVKGYDDLLVYRAKCCNPIRGEEIAGYITVGRGISVHSTNCPNVENLLLDPERRVEVAWTNDGSAPKYPVKLSIHTEDRPGILAAITSAISGTDTNIVNVQARLVDDRFGRVDMTLEVADTQQLEKITNLLKGLDGVRDVERARNRAREASRS